MKPLFTIILALIAQLSVATTLTYQLPLDDFGTLPTTEMKCFKGACCKQPKKPSLIASYVNSQDPDQFYGYEITPPRYDYYQDELFRISFTIKTDETHPDFQLETIEQALANHYDMEWLGEEEYVVNDTLTTYAIGYSSPSGIVAQITWKNNGRCWSYPSIKIQQTELIDKLNQEMNPDYVPPHTRRAGH